MRLLSFVSALLVVAVLYLVLLQRDALMTFARGEGLEQAMLVARGEAPETPAVAAATEDGSADSPDATPAPVGSGSASETATAEDTPAPVRVVGQHSEAAMIDSAVLLRGQTEAARSVDLMAETSSTVTSPPQPKGSVIETGELLCQLDSGTRDTSLAEAEAALAEAEANAPTASARVEEAKALLEEAEINYNAADKLSAGGFASDTTLAARRAAVRSAEAALASAEAGLASSRAAIQSAQAAVATAQKEIDRLQIHAPFGGILESDTAELGSFLQAGSLCATLIALDPIRIVGYLPETDVERVEVGAPARVLLNANRAQAEGIVTFLSRSADPTTRTFKVEVSLPNPDLQIREGQTASLAIAAPGVMAHLLPPSALTLNDDGALGVRIVTAGDRADFVPVEIIRDTPDGVFLTGLPDTADVIVIGQEYVIAGVPVVASFPGEDMVTSQGGDDPGPVQEGPGQ